MIRTGLSIVTIVGLAGVAYADEQSSTDAGQGDKPKRGSFDAGGQLRFPSGPGDDGKFAQFKWVGLDLTGRYFVFDTLSLEANIPLAIIKQDTIAGVDTGAKIFGGFMAGPVLDLDKAFGIDLKLGFLTEKAVLLSTKDAPLYFGDLKFATKIGPYIKFKGYGLEFNLVPQIAYQATSDQIFALQVPFSAAVSLGQTFKIAAELGLYTGDDLDPRPAEGGRIAAGAAIDLKISSLKFHVGGGFASLLTDDGAGSLYHSIGDSVYIDLNVKYVK
jgi:hypothetical protein